VTEAVPRARALDPIPVEVEGQQLIVLRDPVGFAEQVVVMPPVYFILAHCDGQRTLADIKLAFVRQYGVILPAPDARRILEDLDAHHLLESERFEQHRGQVIEAYRRERVRAAAHQGGAYPADPEALRTELDSYYTGAEGPGVCPAEITPAAGDRRVRGLIAPHISIKQGGPCFAWAYRRLCQSPAATTFVILGTGHAGIAGGYAATRKTFETPLGAVEVDTDFLDALERHSGADLTVEEIHHRSEHVIEFQLVFLQHALAGRAPFRIVPILCSFGPEGLADGVANVDHVGETVGRFCAALRRTIGEADRPVCVISSADLAHVGFRYGDRVTLGAPELDHLQSEDAAMLELIRAGSADGFFENLARENNRRRICGFPCIYTMLRALDLRDGELLRYGQSAMDERHSTVSYASMAFYE